MLINPLNWFTGWLTITLLQGNFLTLNTVQALPIDILENPIKQLQLGLEIVSQQIKKTGKGTETCKHASNTTGLNATAGHNITDLAQLLQHPISLDRNLSNLDEGKGNFSSSSKTQASNYPANEENVIRNTKTANPKQHYTNETASLAESKKREQSFASANVIVPSATNETHQNDRQTHNFASFTRSDPVYAGADHQSLYSDAEAGYAISENANRFQETHISLIDKPAKISGNQQNAPGDRQAGNVTHGSHETVSFSRPQKVYSSLDEVENKTETNGIESFNIQEERPSYDNFEHSEPLRLVISPPRNLNGKNVTCLTMSTHSLKPCNATNVNENKLITAEINQQNLTRIGRAINATLASHENATLASHENATLASHENASLEISQKTNNDSGPLSAKVDPQNSVQDVRNLTANGTASNITRDKTESTTSANLDGDSYSTFNSKQLKNFIISSQSKCATEQTITVQERFGDANFLETDLLGLLLNQTLNATNTRRNPEPYHKTLPPAPRKKNDNYDEDDVEESHGETDASKELSVAEGTEQSMALDRWDEKLSSKSIENDGEKYESSTEGVITIAQNLTANTAANLTELGNVNMSNNGSEVRHSDIGDGNFDENATIISPTKQQNIAPNTELINDATESNTTYVTNGTNASLNDSISHFSVNMTDNERNSTATLDAIGESPEHLNTANYVGFEEMSLFEFLVSQLTKNTTAKNATHAASKATSANLKTKGANTAKVTRTLNATTASLNESQAHNAPSFTLRNQHLKGDVGPKIEEKGNEPLTPYGVQGFHEDKASNVISAEIEQNSTVKAAAINANKSVSHIASSFAENEPVTALSKQENLNLNARATESPNSSILTVSPQQLTNSDGDEAGDKANISDETRRVNDYASFREIEVLKTLVNDIVKNLGSKENSTNLKHSSKKTNMTHSMRNKNESTKALNGPVTGKAGQAGAGNITKGPKRFTATDADDEVSGVFKLNEIKPVVAPNQQATNSTPDTNQTASLNASYATNVTNMTSESAAATNTSSVLGETIETASATDPTNEKTWSVKTTVAINESVPMQNRAGATNENTATEDATRSANKSVIAENAPGPRNESVAIADAIGLASKSVVPEPGNERVAIADATGLASKSVVAENASGPRNESVAIADATGLASKSVVAENASGPRNESVAIADATGLASKSVVTEPGNERVATEHVTGSANKSATPKSDSGPRKESMATESETGATKGIVATQNITNPAADGTSGTSESLQQANTTGVVNETMPSTHKTNSTNEIVNATDSIEGQSVMAANAANSVNDSLLLVSPANETIRNKASDLAAIPINVSKDTAPATNAITESVPVAEFQTIQNLASFAEDNPITTIVSQVIENGTNAINETGPCNSSQETLKTNCVTADQQNVTQNTEMINVNSTSKETCSCSAHQQVSAIRNFAESEPFATLKNPSASIEEMLAFEGSKKNQQNLHNGNLIKQNNATNHTIDARLADLQNSTTNKTDMLSKVAHNSSKIAEDVAIDISIYLPISINKEEALRPMRIKNQSIEASTTSNLETKPTTSGNQAKPLGSTEKKLGSDEVAKIRENLKFAFKTNSHAKEVNSSSSGSKVTSIRSFAQNEPLFAEKTKTTNATAHNMHVKMKMDRRSQDEVSKGEFTSDSFRFKPDNDFYRAPHFLYMDQIIKTAKDPSANASTIQANEEETNVTLLVKNVTNSCCQANCNSTMGCENLEVGELLNNTDKINITSSPVETASLTSSLSETPNVTVQVKQPAEKSFAEEAEAMGGKLPAMDQGTQELKENFQPESSSALHNIEFLKIAQNLAYEFARGENQITEEEFGRVAKFQEDEGDELSVGEDTKSITEEDGRESYTTEDESDDITARAPFELSADVEETTTVDAVESIEPDESMYEERAPRKLKHHRNLDGVEMFYGYSSVKHN
uniref:Uncharacterized protein n=1 Tax=Glossina austeni TaxID=7395 RepID=A0A1A9UTJ4_GLOAU